LSFASVIKKHVFHGVSKSAVLSGGEMWPVTGKTMKFKAANSIICGNIRRTGEI